MERANPRNPFPIRCRRRVRGAQHSGPVPKVFLWHRRVSICRPLAYVGAAQTTGCGCMLLHSAGNFLLRCPSCRIPAIVGCYRGAFFAAVAYWAASELLLHAGRSGCDLLRLRSAAAAVFSCCGLLQLRNVIRGFCLARAELQWAAIGQLPSCEVFRFGLTVLSKRLAVVSCIGGGTSPDKAV